MRDYKPRAREAKRRTSGGTLIGVFIGLALGLAIAAGRRALHDECAGAVRHPRRQGAQLPAAGRPRSSPRRCARPNRRAARRRSRGSTSTASSPARKSRSRRRSCGRRRRSPDKSGASKDVYFVQAGAFQNPADADNLKARLALAGLMASVEPATLPDKGIWYRVRLGPFTELDEINRVRSTLAQNGDRRFAGQNQELTESQHDPTPPRHPPPRGGSRARPRPGGGPAKPGVTEINPPLADRHQGQDRGDGVLLVRVPALLRARALPGGGGSRSCRRTSSSGGCRRRSTSAGTCPRGCTTRSRRWDSSTSSTGRSWTRSTRTACGSRTSASSRDWLQRQGRRRRQVLRDAQVVRGRGPAQARAEPRQGSKIDGVPALMVNGRYIVRCRRGRHRGAHARHRRLGGRRVAQAAGGDGAPARAGEEDSRPRVPPAGTARGGTSRCPAASSSPAHRAASAPRSRRTTPPGRVARPGRPTHGGARRPGRQAAGDLRYSTLPTSRTSRRCAPRPTIS